MVINALKNQAKRTEKLNTSREIIMWWEKRRWFFNVAVGIAGLFVLALVLIIGFFAERKTGVPFGLPDPPILIVLFAIFYGLLANLCYTGGWLLEVGDLKIKEKHPDTDSKLFFWGHLISISLTLFWGFLICVLALVRAFAIH